MILLGVVSVLVPLTVAILFSESVVDGVGGMTPTEAFLGVAASRVRSSSKDLFSTGSGAAGSNGRAGEVLLGSSSTGEPDMNRVEAGLRRAASKSAPVRRNERLDEVDGREMGDGDRSGALEDCGRRREELIWPSSRVPGSGVREAVECGERRSKGSNNQNQPEVQVTEVISLD